MDLGRFVAISAATTMDDGRSSGRFKKDVMRVGAFKDNGYGESMVVSSGHLVHWAKTFATMKANGVKVPIPKDHEGWELAENNRGWVHDLYVEGDRLVMNCELIGSDVDAMAARTDVSVYSPKAWSDCDGNEYVMPIRHIAFTPVPLITGLGEFSRIAAASRSSLTQENAMDLEKIKAAMGIKDDITADNAVELVCAAATANTKTVTELTEAVKVLELKLSEKAEPKEGDKNYTPSLLELSLVGKDRRRELELLVASAKITSAVSDKLEAAFVTDDAIRASVSTKRTDEFDALIEALKLNDPVKLGEKSGAQTLVPLKAAAKKGNESGLAADAERRAKAASGK